MRKNRSVSLSSEFYVYEIFDSKTSESLYIGKGRNTRGTVSLATKKKQHPNAEIRILCISPSEEVVMNLELKYIQDIKPSLNKVYTKKIGLRTTSKGCISNRIKKREALLLRLREFILLNKRMPRANINPGTEEFKLGISIRKLIFDPSNEYDTNFIQILHSLNSLADTLHQEERCKKQEAKLAAEINHKNSIIEANINNILLGEDINKKLELLEDTDSLISMLKYVHNTKEV